MPQVGFEPGTLCLNYIISTLQNYALVKLRSTLQCGHFQHKNYCQFNIFRVTKIIQAKILHTFKKSSPKNKLTFCKNVRKRFNFINTYRIQHKKLYISYFINFSGKKFLLSNLVGRFININIKAKAGTLCRPFWSVQPYLVPACLVYIMTRQNNLHI